MAEAAVFGQDLENLNSIPVIPSTINDVFNYLMLEY